MIKRGLREKHKGERGFVLMLVLIMLATGAILIPPWLQLIYTGLRSSQIYENRIIGQTSASAGAMQAMWRLKTNDDGLADFLSPEDPSVSYTTTINGTEVEIDIDLPQSPDLEPPPQRQSGQHLHLVGDSSKRWLKPGFSGTFTYTVNITNYGTSNLHVGEIGDAIPPPFTYVLGSSNGITTVDPVITVVNQRQNLLWALPPPQPAIASGQTLTQSFQVRVPSEGIGIFYSEAWAKDFPVSLGKVSSGPTAPVAVGVYNIHARVRQTTIDAQAAVSSTEMEILSWEE
ncbi:MAG: hypothetical protein U1D67_10950 [Dehalococcoidia bacterium]|nr:hypothetical protein [Dehalococcoidia bacterium]